MIFDFPLIWSSIVSFIQQPLWPGRYLVGLGSSSATRYDTTITSIHFYYISSPCFVVQLLYITWNCRLCFLILYSCHENLFDSKTNCWFPLIFSTSRATKNTYEFRMLSNVPFLIHKSLHKHLSQITHSLIYMCRLHVFNKMPPKNKVESVILHNFQDPEGRWIPTKYELNSWVTLQPDISTPWGRDYARYGEDSPQSLWKAQIKAFEVLNDSPQLVSRVRVRHAYESRHLRLDPNVPQPRLRCNCKYFLARPFCFSVKLSIQHVEVRS